MRRRSTGGGGVDAVLGDQDAFGLLDRRPVLQTALQLLDLPSLDAFHHIVCVTATSLAHAALDR